MTTFRAVKSLLKELDIRFLARDDVLLIPANEEDLLQIVVRESVVDIYSLVDEVCRGQSGFRAVCDSIQNLNVGLSAVSIVFSDGADGGNVVATLQVPIDDGVFEFSAAELKHCLGLLHETVDLVRDPLRLAKYRGQVTDMGVAFAMRRLRQFREAGIRTADDLENHEFSSDQKRQEVAEAFKEAKELLEANGLQLLEDDGDEEADEPEEVLAIAGI